MSAAELKTKIDSIDDEIASLYVKRMELAGEMARDTSRDVAETDGTLVEKATVNRVTKNMPEGMKLYAKQLYDTLFNTARAYGAQNAGVPSSIRTLLDGALAKGEETFPVSATVACQGVAGAYAQIAADKMFPINDILYFKDWDAVFGAVERGLCDYGVLPIENSSVGSVNAVYDLMRKHKCYILRAIRLRVQHYLMAKPGTDPDDVKEIFSHKQAIDQCSAFLHGLKNVKVNVVENTAVAARMVKDSPDKGVACIASESCAGIYGLRVLQPNIQDNDINYTRFIAISKDLHLFEDSDKISIMVNLPHEAGSLNRILNKFSTLGLNLTKLESRPMGNTDFEFAFYFDFEARVDKEEVKNLLSELETECVKFVFLGSYREI